MVTDPRTGVRSIRAARETYAAVAVSTLVFATILRCIEGRPGGIVGAFLTLLAVAVVSRYRISWDREGITCQTPFRHARKIWSELSAYSIEPRAAAEAVRNTRLGLPSLLHGFRLRLYGGNSPCAINLLPYSFQDMQHLRDAVSAELPACEDVQVLVS